MHALFQDVRYALRIMRKNPGMASVVILSLAIGIGATTAVFSVVNALLLRPLHFPEPGRLAVVWHRTPGLGILQDWPSPGQFNDIRSQNHVFDEVALAIGRSATLTRLAQPEKVDVVRTTSNLLDMLGAKLLMGHAFTPEDDRPGKAATAVLTNAIWNRLFGSDPNIIGKSITINATAYTVTGVLRPDFVLNHEVLQTIGGIDHAEIFLPLPLTAENLNDYDDENYNIVARLKPGVTINQAQADVNIIANHIRETRHRDHTFMVSVVPLLEQVVGNARVTVLVLLGSVVLVLLIAIVNVMNLLLSRANGRQKEMAVRTALGAGRSHLVRQLLTESVLFGLFGGATGLLLAALSLYAVRAINPGNIPRIDEIGIDGMALVFTLVVSIVTGIVFGLAPILRVLKLELNSMLKAGGRSSQGDGGFHATHFKLRSVLVVAEMALSLMLLVGAGLLIRSFLRLLDVRPGFDPDHVISMRVALNDPAYKELPARVRFFEDVGERISHLPGVTMQGAISSLPFSSVVNWGTIFVEGYAPPANEPELQSDMRNISPDYLRMMKVPLVKGRYFTPGDTSTTQPVVIVDERVVQRFWPHDDPIGKRLRPGDTENWAVVVGVVKPVKHYGLDSDGRMVIYFPYKQRAFNTIYLVARTAQDPLNLIGDMSRAVHSVDPNIAIYDVDTMQERIHRSLARQRFSMAMLGGFAAFALILAAIGVYGVLSYVVTQGTRDIGVRIVLGAQRKDIFGMVLRHGMVLAIIGIVGGIAGAIVLSHVMESLLFGVKATDAVTFFAVAFFMAMVALSAILLPARRAMNVEPMVAIRDE